MTWEWSHTPEAYHDAENNLHKKDHKWLAECWAEIQSTNVQDGSPTVGHSFDSEAYDKHLIDASTVDKETLVEHIWEFASNEARCDNGGFNAYMCPEGCHTVPFSPIRTFEDDAILILDENRGIYIPQSFAETIQRYRVKGVAPDVWKILEDGPDHEHYWDAWTELLDVAIVTDFDKDIKYYVHQDGDVWLVPSGVEIPES